MSLSDDWVIIQVFLLETYHFVVSFFNFLVCHKQTHSPNEHSSYGKFVLVLKLDCEALRKNGLRFKFLHFRRC